ncbi:MAG: response regulator [Acidobacteriota bacterium]|nr:response regulator [Acidobacteriota bacterium]
MLAFAWFALVLLVMTWFYYRQPDQGEMDTRVNRWRLVFAGESLAAALSTMDMNLETIPPARQREVWEALRGWEQLAPEDSWSRVRIAVEDALEAGPETRRELTTKLVRELMVDAQSARTQLEKKEEKTQTGAPYYEYVIGFLIIVLTSTALALYRSHLYLAPQRQSDTSLRNELASFERGPKIEESDDLSTIRMTLRKFMNRHEEAVRALNLINSLNEGLLIVSPDGVIEWVNKSICKMIGYSEGELIGREFTDIYVKLKTIHVQGFFKQRETYKEEELFKTKEGKVIPVRFSSSFLFDEESDVSGFVCIAKDITREKLAEEELQRQNEWFKVTLASIGDAVLTTDRDNKVAFLNNIAAELIGINAADAQEKPLEKVLKLLDPNTREPLEMLCGDRLNEVMPESKDSLLERQDGKILEIEQIQAPIRSTTGKLNGTVIVFRDKTGTNRDAEELLSAKEHAEAAAEAKAHFLANMSHEIRTPMNAVIGMTGLLLDTNLTAEQREAAEIVRGSGEALLTLINDILDFSKVEAGKLELEIIDFDMRVTIEEVGDLLAQKAQNKGLEFINLVHQDIPLRVQGDPGRLRQVLLNLADNAVKFTTEGEVLIEASLEETLDDSILIRFDIKDTGIGIPEDRLSRLFVPFSQVDASTTRKYGGTGLGLAICKQLTEAMGGRIWVESSRGEGTTFSFTAQFSKVSEKEKEKEEEPLTLDLDFSNLKVLVVDGNANNRRALRVQLQHRDCQVLEAPGGESVLTLLGDYRDRGKSIDLTILDFRLPEYDAMDLVEAIREVYPEMRFLLLTSIPSRGDAREAVAHGVDGYLTKPIKLHRLYDNIAAVMRPEEYRERDKNKLVTSHFLREHDTHRYKILVVEDNIINQKVVVRLLSKVGYRCDVAANGLEAVEALGRIPYDLVLMDCQMPEMDGFQATKMIREREEGDNHIPIVAMTANALSGDREDCLAAGMDDYLSKPLEQEKLYETLQKLLRAN